MPITSFTIDGVEVDPILESFEVRETIGEVSTLICDVESLGSPVARFELRSVVEVEEDGVKIFAGRLTQLRERGFAGEPNLYDPDTDAEQIATSITAEDYARLAEHVIVTETVAAGTLLKAFLTTLVTTYLSTLGVTLHASQVDGPALPEMKFDKATGADVLRALEDATGYLSRIDYDKALRMWAPGDITAPFNISEFDDPARWTDDVEVENILGDDFANRVIVVGPVIEEYGRTETWTGDGVTDEFELVYTPFAYRVVQVGNGPSPSYQTVTDPSLEGTGAAMWVYDPTTNTIRRDLTKFPDLGIPGVGEYIGFNIDGRFQPTAEAGPPSGTDPADVVEIRIDSDNITDQASAQALADSLLEEHLNAGEQRVAYKTRYASPTFRVGQQQTITASPRQLSGDYLITDLSVRAEVPVTAVYDASNLGFIRSITAKQNHATGGKYQQTYRDWLKDTKGSSGQASGIAQAGPGGSDTDVQFNDKGKFGGKETFQFKKRNDTATIGINHEAEALFISDCGDTDDLTAWDQVAANMEIVAGGGKNGTNGIGSNIAPYMDPWLIKRVSPTPVDRIRVKYDQYIPPGTMPFTGFVRYIVGAVYYNGGGAFDFGDRQVSINTNDDGRFYFLRGSWDTGTTIAGPTTNPIWEEDQWITIEYDIVISNTEGSIRLWKNGVLELEATGLDTQFLGTAAIDGVEIVPQSVAGGTAATIDNVEIQVAHRNLLVGQGHTVRGYDDLLVGTGHDIRGDVSEAHGSDITIRADRAVGYGLDGAPHTLTENGKFTIFGDFEVTGTATIGGAGSGDVAGPSASVDSEIALFDSTTGKLLKRATGTGFVRVASGVYSAAKLKRTVGMIIGDGANVISTGVQGFVSSPVAGVITKVRLLSIDAAVTSGSIVLDIWKDTYANYPPVVGDSITASAKPTITTAIKSEDSTLTGWTTAVSAGDVFGFNVDSVTAFKRIAIELTVEE